MRTLYPAIKEIRLPKRTGLPVPPMYQHAHGNLSNSDVIIVHALIVNRISYAVVQESVQAYQVSLGNHSGKENVNL